MHDDEFVAGYVRSVLLRSGAEVVGLTTSEVLRPRNPAINAYVVGRQHGSAVHDLIMRRGEPCPAVLLLDGQLPDPRPRRTATLASPFAGYQVVDAVVHLLAESNTGIVEVMEQV